MARDKAERIRRLSAKMQEKANQLNDIDPLAGSRLMSDITDHIVAGTGLLDLGSQAEKRGTGDDGDSASEAEGDSSEYSDDGSDSDLETEPNDESIDEDELLQFLNGLQPAIIEKHNPRPIGPIPGLRSHVQPYAHQQHAAAVAVQALESRFKGVILADLPGLGKTLAALMAAAASRRPEDGPCIVVAPVSCCRQWMREISRWFDETSMKPLLLLGEAVHPAELFKYHVVVTSYGQVVAELLRIAKFNRAIRDHTGIFQYSNKPVGRMLVLDEAHTIKNHRGRTYAAISVLRRSCTACIMLTGTPLDNTWIDAYALFSLLEGHPITSMQQMRDAFTIKPNRKRGLAPSGRHLLRIIQALDACTLRRPQSAIQSLLMPITMEVVQFDLSKEDLKASNEEFSVFWRALYASRKDKKRYVQTTSREERKKKQIAGFSSLIKAQQIANHPLLITIISLEKDALLRAINDDEPSADVEVDIEGQRLFSRWRANLGENENWHSSRVDTIIDVVNRHRDWRPGDAFVIVDESVYFLSILEVALQSTYDPVPCFSYDGRKHPAEREIVLNDFRAASGTRILLASRGTGGVGLNIQSANVLIRCSPWWKKSWEDQAVGRLYRPGQDKPVFVYELQAKGCRVEMHKTKKRDQKNRTNTKIMDAVTRLDDAELPAARRCL